MIDLDAIKARVLRPEHGGPAMPGVCLVDGALLAALVAEVERLREVNDGYLLEMGRQHALLREQKRGENAERAAVMTFINERAEKIRFTLAERSIPLLKDISYCIERGEHRREEGA